MDKSIKFREIMEKEFNKNTVIKRYLKDLSELSKGSDFDYDNILNLTIIFENSYTKSGNVSQTKISKSLNNMKTLLKKQARTKSERSVQKICELINYRLFEILFSYNIPLHEILEEVEQLSSNIKFKFIINNMSALSKTNLYFDYKNKHINEILLYYWYGVDLFKDFRDSGEKL